MILEMFKKELRFSDFHISLSEICEEMGYKDTIPDVYVENEIQVLFEKIKKTIRPRFAFLSFYGALDEPTGSLIINHVTFNLGKIISRQLGGSELFVLFVATVGDEFDAFQHSLRQENDLLKIYIADVLGSIIVEKTADCMEASLQEYIHDKGWKHTNRFSPGYCGWHVSEQEKLFSLFPELKPCGISLTDSSMMSPVKSVSGVIGIGNAVRKMEYTCGLCTYDKCYRRKSQKK